MQRTYRKNTLRTIKETFGRFAAIFAIVALGVGFLVGLLSSTPDMRYSFDKYFDESSMYDVRVLGDLGLTSADITKLKGLDGVQTVQPGYVADVLMSGSETTEYTVRMHSIGSDGGAINTPVLTSGRLPAKSDECVLVNVPLSKTKFSLGDKLSVSDNNKNTDDTLRSTEYTVVGFADYCPYFSAEKEYTNIGSGTVDLFMLVPDSSFATDFYTDVYITVKGASALTALTSEYQSLVDETAVSIESLSQARGSSRYDEFVAEATQKLSNAKSEYSDAKSEADTKLSDAQKQISDGWSKISSGDTLLADAWVKITDSEKTLAANETALNRQQADIKAQFAEADTKLLEAQIELDKNLANLNESYSAADSELESYGLSETARAAFDELRALTVTYPSLIGDMEALRQKSDRLNEIEKRLTEIGALPYEEKQTYADEAAALLNERLALQAQLGKIMSGEAYNAYVGGAGRLAAAGVSSDKLPALALRLGAIDSAKLRLASAQAELDGKRADFTAQKSNAEGEISAARKKISDGKTELLSAKNEYYSQLSKLNESKDKLRESQGEFEASKAEADGSLAEAQQKITDAEAKISELKVPTWHVFTRHDNISYSSIEANIDKVNSIAKVFPFFFFLVAALVALTTMTRMVEDERLQIGTMKALGYSRSAIIRKYLIYALSASALGSAAGVAVGFKLFPTVIWNAYTMMYELPNFYCPLNWVFALLTSAAAIVCVLLATLNACRSTLKEKPSQLMLLKAPEAGKRVLLERITPIWSRMKFTHKVTARNLFRYKKRFLMTTIGVAGCTALLVTGFGLRDSFSDIAERQFGVLNTYDIMAPVENEANFENPELLSVLNNSENVADALAVNNEAVETENGGKAIEVYTFISDKASDLNGIVNFRNRVSGKALDFEECSVILTEKASEILKVKVGDPITVTDKDGNSGSFTITGICENYVRNYIYMSEGTYAKGMGHEAVKNMLIIRLTDAGVNIKTELGKSILETGAVSGISYTSNTKTAISRALSKIDTIVFVVILSAGALAFVVLYNLTNINISERVKEIATIKVLGFTDREVNSYINRESLILSMIGAVFGLVLGVFLHRYVMGSAEMDSMMFGRSVRAISFVYSAALTMAFSVLVDLIMRRKLRRISMVESMKAPE